MFSLKLIFDTPGRRLSRGLRTVRQEQLFQPKLNKLSLTSFVATEVGRRERGTSLQGEFSEARESGSATGIQAKQMAEREERLGLQARMSSSPPYSPQRSSTPGDIITIDRCLDHSLTLLIKIMHQRCRVNEVFNVDTESEGARRK